MVLRPFCLPKLFLCTDEKYLRVRWTKTRQRRGWSWSGSYTRDLHFWLKISFIIFKVMEYLSKEKMNLYNKDIKGNRGERRNLL